MEKKWDALKGKGEKKEKEVNNYLKVNNLTFK